VAERLPRFRIHDELGHIAVQMPDQETWHVMLGRTGQYVAVLTDAPVHKAGWVELAVQRPQDELTAPLHTEHQAQPVIPPRPTQADHTPHARRVTARSNNRGARLATTGPPGENPTMEERSTR
jgi:hypothetical protein